MSNTPLSHRWYDEQRNRVVCASPRWMTIWHGSKPGKRLIAGPLPLSPAPQDKTELMQAYNEWMEAGEPE